MAEYQVSTNKTLTQRIESEVSKQVAHFETRQPNFGFVNGQHYYSPGDLHLAGLLQRC